MKHRLAAFARRRALQTGKSVGLWRRLEYPQPDAWAAYLKKYGGFASFGERCAVDPMTLFTDPYLTRVGNNVRIAGAKVFGHDGSVNMINAAFGSKLDNVGPVNFHDNVFIGVETIVLPGVSIGPNCIIGAGSVVSRDVPPNCVAVGTPAKPVCTLDDYVQRLTQRSQTWPWMSLVASRTGEFDPAVEDKLQELRVRYFFADS
ncbi:MAG: acyltransferase [Planctomycetota bacterium]